MAKLVAAMQLLSRGDRLYFEKGRLVIEPASGEPVPEDWYKDNWLRLAVELLEMLGQEAYQYVDYSTGKYGKRKAGGVTLHYQALLGDERPRVSFNAELERARKSKNGEAGSRLPGRQFRVNENYAIAKYWKSLGLDAPPKWSELHRRMGKLKSILVTGERICDGDGKGHLKKGSVQPLETAPFVPESVDNSSTSCRQEVDKLSTRDVDKYSPQAQQPPALQVDSSTPQISTVKGNKGNGLTDAPLAPIRGLEYQSSAPLDLAEQSTEDWLREYEGGDCH